MPYLQISEWYVSHPCLAQVVLLAALNVAMAGCAGNGGQQPTAADQPGAVEEQCETPAWYQHAEGAPGWATGTVGGYLIGLGQAATLQQARERAMQDILQQGRVNVKTLCMDRRQSQRVAGASAADSPDEAADTADNVDKTAGKSRYDETGFCETRLEASLQNRQFTDLQMPHSCGGQMWVKLGLDMRSIRERLLPLLQKQGSLPGQGSGLWQRQALGASEATAATDVTYCAGVQPLTGSPLCRWLHESLAGLGALPVGLRWENHGWEYLLAGQTLRLDLYDLPEVLAWQSLPGCQDWFALEQDGLPLERIDAGKEYTVRVSPSPSVNANYYSLLTVYPDGRTQLLLDNQPLQTMQTHRMQAVLEPGQSAAQDVAVLLRHQARMDWSGFGLHPRRLAGQEARAQLPVLLDLMQRQSSTTLCIQTLRVQSPTLGTID
jgi:hypothetical protein